MLDKIRGGLVGLAIGDALGGTTEFMSEQQIVRQYGRVTDIIGGGVWDLEPGEITDDTAMTICVARGIIRSPENPMEEIGHEFMNWFNRRPKDAGAIISRALSSYKGSWKEAAYTAHITSDGKSAGNGTLMRCLPIPLAYKKRDLMERLTKEQSEMTHYDQLATETCLIYNRIALRLLENESLQKAIEQETKETIYAQSLGEEPQVPPDGFVVRTFKWVLYYLTNLSSFEDIAIAAANKGGDSDTIAAIACGIKGVEIGYHALPERFKEKIIIKDELEDLAVQLNELRK